MALAWTDCTQTWILSHGDKNKMGIETVMHVGLWWLRGVEGW
jgi:hypothetical protein